MAFASVIKSVEQTNKHFILCYFSQCQNHGIPVKEFTETSQETKRWVLAVKLI